MQRQINLSKLIRVTHTLLVIEITYNWHSNNLIAVNSGEHIPDARSIFNGFRYAWIAGQETTNYHWRNNNYHWIYENFHILY